MDISQKLNKNIGKTSVKEWLCRVLLLASQLAIPSYFGILMKQNLHIH